MDNVKINFGRSIFFLTRYNASRLVENQYVEFSMLCLIVFYMKVSRHIKGIQYLLGRRIGDLGRQVGLKRGYYVDEEVRADAWITYQRACLLG